MPVVSSHLVDRIRVIVIDNPPVNATSQAVRQGLLDAVAAADGDAGAGAIVIACAGSTFIAGADIKEFGLPPADPHLSAVIDRIEQAGKPVVAALHGTVLGGGLEVALGCHYRVAQAGTRLGLPEVTLGVIPGAGGIPRLLRLAGPEKALDMMIGGKPIGADAARAAEVVDLVVEGDVREAAIGFARGLLAQGQGPRRTCDMNVAACPPAFLDALRAKLQKTHRGQPAPFVCLDVAQAALEGGVRDSVALSRQRFRDLVISPEARALRHAFFAERVATRRPELPEPERDIACVGVVGAGTMGTGIALCMLNAGLSVVLVEQDEQVLAASQATIRKTCEADVAKGRVSAQAAQDRLARLTATLDYAALAPADLVIEAVFESMDVKREVFMQVDRAARPGAILASNTSYLDIDELAGVTSRPESVVGMHFFSPAHIMKLLENVRAARSSPQALAGIQALGKRIGKVAVLVGVSDGFVGNRMLAKRTRECYFLLEEGALPHEVDRVLYDFGFPIGQFQLNDLAGLDVAWRNRQGRLDRLTPREVACDILDEIVATGRLGQKSGSGYYKYDERRRHSVDPEVDAMVVANAERRGIVRRGIPPHEILERCLYAMVNEGARILEEGVASRPEDIDTIWLNGYGFPRHRGGPMYYADQVGLKVIHERILHYARTQGEQYWTPAPLLARLAREGGTFYGR